MYLALQRLFNFSKWSRPLPKLNKIKQQKKSLSIGDEKAAKLSKSEQQLQNKQKIVQDEKMKKQIKRNMAIYRRHDSSLDQYLSQDSIDKIFEKQILYLKGANLMKRKYDPIMKLPTPVKNFQHLPTDRTKFSPTKQIYVKKSTAYGNYVAAVNSKFKSQIKIFDNDNHKLRRIGCIGIKLGMTTLWDKWGAMIPVTVIEVDRCQVIQIKEGFEGFKQVQMGMGQSNLKRITKPLLGHFLKAKVPPKRKLAEFKVSPQCLLPIGYMMSVRHYTPGMYVDVESKTVGHGFTGTIKKFGFRRQPATHGNSLTTRVLGSTGQRQDAGRVFKQKKMYGRMGGYNCVQAGMTVYKIDTDKNILYILGSVPGKAGTIVNIRDTLVTKKAQKNLQLCWFPTFVEQPGEKYARQLSRYAGERDPEEIQIHDNSFIIDGQDEDASATPTGKQIPQD